MNKKWLLKQTQNYHLFCLYQKIFPRLRNVWSCAYWQIFPLFQSFVSCLLISTIKADKPFHLWSFGWSIIDLKGFVSLRCCVWCQLHLCNALRIWLDCCFKYSSACHLCSFTRLLIIHLISLISAFNHLLCPSLTH